jgi:hypothetical protein
MMEDEVARGWRDPELVSLFAQVSNRLATIDSSESGAGNELDEMQASLENMRRKLSQPDSNGEMF